MRRPIIIVLALAIPLLVTSLPAREWVDASGTYKVEAELVEATNKQVTLKLQDGSTVQVPLEKLSRSDRLHVAERLSELAKHGDRNPAKGKPGNADAQKQPLMLAGPTFLKNEKGNETAIVAKVTATNNQPIPEKSLLPVVVMFAGAVDGELFDLRSDPKSLVNTSNVIFDANSDPGIVIINHTWDVASEQGGVNGKATGAVPNYKPGSAETILYVSNRHSSLEDSFGKTPADGGTWGLFLVDRKLRRISNVLRFSKDDLEEVKYPAKVYGDRMKALAE